jgi:hypothetical protein
MSTTPTAIETTDEATPLQRLRDFCGSALFIASQRFPRLLQLHRNERSWTLFRVFLGFFGAALVVLPLSLWSGWFTALFGMAFFILSILLPPAAIESATDERARELGARTVVSGGEYQPGNAPAAHVQLFVSPAHVWAIDKHLEPLLVIPAPAISSLRMEFDEERWLLQIRWDDHKAEFAFDGFFAERLAALAEDSIRAVLPAGQLRSATKTRVAGV